MKSHPTKPSKTLTNPSLNATKKPPRHTNLKNLDPKSDLLTDPKPKTPTAIHSRTMSGIDISQKLTTNIKKFASRTNLPTIIDNVPQTSISQIRLLSKGKIHEDQIADSPRSLQAESVDAMEKEILLEQIEQQNAELSKLRFENELMKRKTKSSSVLTSPVNFKNNEFEQKVTKLNQELTEKAYAYQELLFKYESLQREKDNYENTVNEQLEKENENLREEIRAELKKEMNDKDDKIKDLEQEKKKYEQIILTLRSKANITEQYKNTVEQERALAKKNLYELEAKREAVKKLNDALTLEKGESEKLSIQIKELIEKCDEYENRINEAENEANERNDEISRLADAKDSVQNELEEWKKLAEEYKKQLDEIAIQHPSYLSKSDTKLSPASPSRKSALPMGEEYEHLHNNIKSLQEQMCTQKDQTIQSNQLVQKKFEEFGFQQKCLLDKMSELNLVFKSLKEELKHPMPIPNEKTNQISSTIFTSALGPQDKSIVVIDDLDASLNKHDTPKNLMTSISMHGFTTSAPDTHRQKQDSSPHRRAWSSTYEKLGNDDIWSVRRRSFAKNLGIAWENMQHLKEISTSVFEKTDSYLLKI